MQDKAQFPQMCRAELSCIQMLKTECIPKNKILYIYRFNTKTDIRQNRDVQMLRMDIVHVSTMKYNCAHILYI